MSELPIPVDYVAYRRAGRPGFEWWAIATDGSGRGWFVCFEFEGLLRAEIDALPTVDAGMILPNWAQCMMGPTFQRMQSGQAYATHLDAHWTPGTPPSASL